MTVSADRQDAVMAGDVHRCATGIRIQRGGHAVVTGHAQTGIHRVELIQHAARVGAVKDIAVDGVAAGDVEITQRVGGAVHAWRDGDGPHAQPRDATGKVQRIGPGVEIQPGQRDVDTAAQQRAAAEGAAADHARAVADGPVYRQPAQRQQRGHVKVQRRVVQRGVRVDHEGSAAGALG